MRVLFLNLISALAMATAAWSVSGVVGAQTTPSAAEMIEQLKTPPAGRTRGMRNLAIGIAPEATPEPAQVPTSTPTPAATPAAAMASTSPPLNAASTTKPITIQTLPTTSSVPTPAPTPVAQVQAAAESEKPSLSLMIQFDFNSAKIKPESLQVLGNLAQALQSEALANSRFAVEGHTDAKGSADYNLKLSQLRAQAVRTLLQSKGVNAARLVATGKGATAPADPADPMAAVNRRVRVVNLN
jgi:OmpA-OmpF porin, OOP family